MNQSIQIELLKQNIIKTINDSELDISVKALMLNGINIEIQNLAQVQLQKEYNEYQETLKNNDEEESE